MASLGSFCPLNARYTVLLAAARAGAVLVSEVILVCPDHTDPFKVEYQTEPGEFFPFHARKVVPPSVASAGPAVVSACGTCVWASAGFGKPGKKAVNTIVM
jgi:hypothetical protein